MAESHYAMLPVPEALEIVLAQAQVLETVQVPLVAALGRVLAEPVLAQDPLPPFAASIKDGYAVWAADGPGEYAIVGEATAGRIPPFAVTPGSVAYITTGAPVPPGADAVVMVEETERLPGRNGVAYVRIGKQVKPGADVRPIGYDVAMGEEVLPAGVRLGAAEAGAAGDGRPGRRAGGTAAASRRAVDGRRACGCRCRTPAGQDPRQQPQHPAGGRDGGGR